MIHHVGLEIAKADEPACLAFWALLGWHPVARPEGIRDGHWVERDGFQIHLQIRDAPVAPTDGHPALVYPDLGAVAERLAAAGYEVVERERYWGARRIFVRCPAGHRVELMSAPPGGRPLASPVRIDPTRTSYLADSTRTGTAARSPRQAPTSDRSGRGR